MNDHRRQILEMLAAGKINADEAERLIAAIEDSPVAAAGVNGQTAAAATKARPKYLRVLVDTKDKEGPTTVNVRVPLELLRAGVRLASLVPPHAHQQLDQALSRHGVPLTLSQIKPENLEEVVDHLDDLTVDVDASEENTKVRVFCE